MRLVAFAIVFCSLFLAGSFAPGQVPTLVDPTTEPGIVVESVAKDTQAEKLGILPGDRWLYWTLGNAKGRFETPFDQPYVRLDQASRGLVTVHGVRGGKAQTWRFGSDTWGAVLRPNLSGQFLSIANEAVELLATRQPARAAERFRAAALLARSQGSSRLASWFFSRAGQALFQAQQWKQVDAVYEEALQDATTADPITRGELLRQRAAGFEYREDFVNAARWYQAVLREWQNFRPGSMVVAHSLVLLANVDLRRFEVDEAEACLEQALPIVEEIAPASAEMVSILDDFGVVFGRRGDFVKAEDYYRKALVIEERYRPGTRQVANILTNLGTMAQQQGNLGKAEAYHRRALAIAERLQRTDLTIADVLSHLAECVLQRGDSASAEKYEQRALLLRQQVAPNTLSAASSLVSLSGIARVKADLGKAEAYSQQASAMAAQVNAPAAEVARFLVGEAQVQSDLRNFHRAEELYRQGLGILEKAAPGSIPYAEAIAELAGVLRQEKQSDEAARLYQKALGALANTSYLAGYGEQRSLYRATHARYYREYAEVLLELSQPALAFQVLDGSRAITLREMLLETHVDVRQGADYSLLERGRRLESMIHAKSEYRVTLSGSLQKDERLSAADAEIEDLVGQYEHVRAQLRVSSPSYAALTDPQSLSAAGIQGLLGADTMLLEYSLGDERSYVWAVTETSLAVYELPKRATIEALAHRLYRLLALPNRTGGASDKQAFLRAEREYERVSQELSRLVIEPVAQLLEQKRLLIVADGALEFIPFSALSDPQNPTAPLVLKHEIANLPSASILAEIRQQALGRKPAPKTVAVLADPVFDLEDERVAPRSPANTAKSGNGLPRDLTRSAADFGLSRNGKLHLPRLLYTRQEADAIVAATPAGKAFEAVDFRASERMATSPLLANYRIVHFATHGLLNSKHPQLSGLVFSMVDERGRPQDGFLRLQDIYNLDLPVDLVVLSGCQTGLGEEVNGEGLIGLTRGFMYAGASRVVASLWSVDDLATSELMARFYRAMEREKMPPAAALRKAQIQTWKQEGWRSPYYWAAFQIQGDWK